MGHAVYNKNGRKYNMHINKDKTKTMIINKNENQNTIQLEQQIRQVEKFMYLRTVIAQNGRLDEEI